MQVLWTTQSPKRQLTSFWIRSFEMISASSTVVVVSIAMSSEISGFNMTSRGGLGLLGVSGMRNALFSNGVDTVSCIVRKYRRLFYKNEGPRVFVCLCICRLLCTFLTRRSSSLKIIDVCSVNGSVNDLSLLCYPPENVFKHRRFSLRTNCRHVDPLRTDEYS